MVDISQLNEDERRLAELGYKQELHRSWSGFSNFAISFSIISILAGCFTTFGVGWNNGGPAAIAWGWPIISVFILIIGFCMSELVSAFPTSGGIYWWASKLGGAKAGYYTGWLNLIGLLAICASVAYGAATFLDLSLSAFSTSWAANYSLTRVFVLFLGILVLAGAINIFSSHLLALVNNVSVWWHVFGATLVVLILVFAPPTHLSVSKVFTTWVNNTGFNSGNTSGIGFWLYILPLSFILTQYTITGYDASAHLSEETHSAADSAAKGIWRSIFYSAIGGWIVLLAFLFAVQDVDGVTKGGGGVAVIFGQALTSHWSGTVLIISTAGQVFCTIACMTSATRMLYAFSRDGAVPGAQLWSKLSPTRVPINGVILTVVVALIITAPALVQVDINGAPVPVAFYAVVTIGVVGLYVAFAIPIYLRWRAGDSFVVGNWTLGNKYKWMAPIAVAEIAVTSVIAMLPGSPLAIPGQEGFALKYVNYTPVVVIGALFLLWIGWHLSAKKWFTGPKHTIDLPAGVTAADEIALEHHHEGYLTGEHHDPPAQS
ncbi:MAG: amino acid permease [Nocardioidaceae bacterium]